MSVDFVSAAFIGLVERIAEMIRTLGSPVRGEWFDTPLNDAEKFIEDAVRDLGELGNQAGA